MTFPSYLINPLVLLVQKKIKNRVIAVLISLAAIVVMFYCLGLVLTLRKNIPGGVVGNTWKTLTSLVILFTLGYLVTPFFGLIPPILVNVLVSLIFFFGAVYVVITVKLIYRIIKELTE